MLRCLHFTVLEAATDEEGVDDKPNIQCEESKKQEQSIDVVPKCTFVIVVTTSILKLVSVSA